MIVTAEKPATCARLIAMPFALVSLLPL
jgi:hypothetical protein